MDMTILTRLLMLNQNIYTLWGLSSLLLPVTYIFGWYKVITCGERILKQMIDCVCWNLECQLQVDRDICGPMMYIWISIISGVNPSTFVRLSVRTFIKVSQGTHYKICTIRIKNRQVFIVCGICRSSFCVAKVILILDRILKSILGKRYATVRFD